MPNSMFQTTVTHVVLAELALLIVFLLIALSIFLRGLYVLIRAKRMKERVLAAEAKLHEFLHKGDLQRPPILERTPEVRNLIVRLATQVGGELRNRLLVVYRANGFTEIDYRLLKRGTLDQQMLAFDRVRVLGETIPEDLWPSLLTHRSVIFRWAVMEHMVHTKGKTATFSLIRVLSEKGNQSRGMALHLLCCLAKSSPESIPWLLELTDNDILKEQMLHTLHVYPVPGTEQLISRVVRKSSPEPILIAGIKALLAHPHEGLVGALSVFAEHPNWIIRVLIAKGLASHATPKALRLLSTLAEDINYFVRSNAVRSLLALRPLSLSYLSKIRRSKDHPSYYLHNQLIITESAAQYFPRRVA